MRNVAGEDGYYSFPVAFLNGQIAEDALQSIESSAARHLKKIRDNRSLNMVGETPRQQIARFVAMQSFRTGAFLGALLEKHQNLTKEAIFGELWRSAVATENELLDRHWFLMETLETDPYYIGDHPVTLQHTEDPGGGRQLGFDVPGVEAYMPLSPTLAIYFPSREISDFFLKTYESAREICRQALISDKVREPLPRSDSDYLKAAKRVIQSGRAWSEAQRTGQPFTYSSEVTTNFNALQIMFAELEIYSHADDFSFAEKVLKKTPNYAKRLSTDLALLIPNVKGANHG